jgi:hypothetical protein
MPTGISDQVLKNTHACGKEQLISFQHWKLSNLLKEFMSTWIVIAGD